MANDEDKLIKKYGIVCKQKIVYSYKGYNYDNLKDAVNFAKIDLEGEEKNA